MGSIYQRGKTYWIQYYRNGKPYRESTGGHKEVDAKRLLKLREGEISQGKLPGVYFDRIRFDELAKDFLIDYEINAKKSLNRAKLSINHLAGEFKDVKVSKIDSPAINRYIQKRLNEGVANGTINRELSALKRLLNLAARQTPPKVDRVPYIPMLQENNIRKGFFEHGEFEAVRDNLPDYLKGYVTFAYKVGWRKSEISGLTWSQVDRKNWIVHLEPGETKNSDARTIHLDEELKAVFQKQWKDRKASQTLSPYVFPTWDGKEQIKDIRKAWETACKNAKIGRKLFHDFRRTAVRNMVRAGIPERVAMLVSGHKTRAIFDRYNIVNDADLKLAAQRQEVYLNEQSSNRHKTATIHHFDPKKEVNYDS